MLNRIEWVKLECNTKKNMRYPRGNKSELREKKEKAQRKNCKTLSFAREPPRASGGMIAGRRPEARGYRRCVFPDRSLSFDARSSPVCPLRMHLQRGAVHQPAPAAIAASSSSDGLMRLPSSRCPGSARNEVEVEQFESPLDECCPPTLTSFQPNEAPGEMRQSSLPWPESMAERHLVESAMIGGLSAPVNRGPAGRA